MESSERAAGRATDGTVGLIAQNVRQSSVEQARRLQRLSVLGCPLRCCRGGTQWPDPLRLFVDRCCHGSDALLYHCCLSKSSTRRCTASRSGWVGQVTDIACHPRGSGAEHLHVV